MTKHVMFVSLPLLGHTNQMIALSQELVDRGYQVSFVIAEEAREWILDTGSDFIPWNLKEENADKTVNDYNKELWQRVSKEPSIWRSEKMMLNGLITRYVFMYKTLLPIFQKNNPDLLIIDRAVIPAMDLAQQMNLPYIIQTRFLGNFVPSDPKYPRFGTSFPIQMDLWQRWLNFLRPYWLLPNILPTMIKLDRVRKQCGAHKKFNDLFNQNPIIVGTAFGIEISRPLPPQVHMVGPIFSKVVKPLSPSLVEWLENDAERAEVVYVSFGTLATIEPWQAKALVEGLSDKKFRILWSLPKKQQHILPALPTSIRIEDFVPQLTLLSHPTVRVFISHCGMNSINEALYWGKPILGLPLFGDQHYNAARIVDLGAALKLDKRYFDNTEVRRKINILLNNPNYTDAAKRMSFVLKSTGGLNKAADIVETTLNEEICHLAPSNAM